MSIIKKKFIVTIFVDEKTIAEKNTNYSINYDSVEEYMYSQMDRLYGYENIKNREQGINEWAEWIEYKEVVKVKI
jgi:hypothetical protein|tara:strand:- start:416 stop:640 length:225 start_codon:yes stop_codon:yes gene_type:complete